MTRVNPFLLGTFWLLTLCFLGCKRTNQEGPELSQVSQRSSSDPLGHENSFGERQLEQLMSDRPEMQGILPKDHAVYRWLVGSFEKDRTGSRIYWVADPTQSGEPAEHAPAHNGYPAYICINAGEDTRPLDKWSMLVFEMFNIENTESIRLLSELGIAGKIDGDTFARKCVELEFQAALKTKTFLQENPLPNPDADKDVQYTWFLSDDERFHDQAKLWDSDSNYLMDTNYRHFKKYFDESIAPYISSGEPESP